jgi:hypothetical protein
MATFNLLTDEGHFNNAIADLKAKKFVEAKKVFAGLEGKGSINPFCTESSIQFLLTCLMDKTSRATAVQKLIALAKKANGINEIKNALTRWEPEILSAKSILGKEFCECDGSIQELGRDFVVEVAWLGHKPAFVLAGSILVKERHSYVDGCMFWKLALPEPTAKAELDSYSNSPAGAKFIQEAEEKKKLFLARPKTTLPTPPPPPSTRPSPTIKIKVTLPPFNPGKSNAEENPESKKGDATAEGKKSE